MNDKGLNHKGMKRIMIAAPKSGSGKTTVTCALLQALKNRGYDPSSFKCGPDYIDPMFHRRVLGIESRNLDTFFSGKEGVKDILFGSGSPCAVIEGVMGLYDGRGPESTDGSCYEIAEATDTPILLVVDASGIGRTVISLIRGMLADDRCHLIRGILLNGITERFYEKLCPVLERELTLMREDVKLLGFLPKDPAIGIASRHLGLVLPEEIGDIRERIDRAANSLERSADLAGILSLMEQAKEMPAPEKKHSKSIESPVAGAPRSADERPPVLAVACDEAFCFYYKENLELFEKYGAAIRYFSPLRDEALPEDTAGILLGGGYPENHLEKLSQNTSMLCSIRAAIEKGIPSLAECGGFMYLHRTVTDRDGRSWKMAQVIDGDCHFAGHLVRFGYMEILPKDPAKEPDPGSAEGLRGHEFHYYESTNNGCAFRAAKPDRSKSWECIITEHNGNWGFPHFYYPSKPSFVADFVRKMKEVSHGEFQQILCQ